MTAKIIPLVRYVSPFGSPAWMSRDRALAHLNIDDRRWVWYQHVEAMTGNPMISDEQRTIGAPRIEVS